MASGTSALNSVPRLRLPQGAMLTQVAEPTASGEVVLDGRRFVVSRDPQTGDTLLDHTSTTPLPDGAASNLAISLRIRADGTVQRMITQSVTGPADGAKSTVVTTTELDAQGRPTDERRDVTVDDGAGSVVTEHSRTDFNAGRAVQRNTEQVRTLTQTGADGTRSTSTQQLTLVTGDGTAPIGDSDPADVSFRDELVQVTPGEGYTKGSDRTITQVRTAVGNTATGLLFDENLDLRVRFDVRDGSYIERVATLALDRSTGQPAAGATWEFSDTIDTRPIWEKGLEKARIWGSFSGSWASVIGINMANPRLARGLGAAGLALSAAGTAGNAYAWQADYRNGSPFDTARSFYDTLVAGSLYGVIRMRNPVAAARLGGSLLGASSIANSSERLLTGPGALPTSPTPATEPLRAPAIDPGLVEAPHLLAAAQPLQPLRAVPAEIAGMR